jgi:DNA-binding response OmpR family regulator
LQAPPFAADSGFAFHLLPECNVAAIENARRCVTQVTMRKKILVVDDDPEAIELVVYNLKKAGFSVGTAADGVEALRKACSIAPDFILLDLMMPELDGFAVCEILRRDPATATVPIIMVTAWSTELARCAGLEAGANDYVTKPFSPRDLVSRVAKALEASRTRDAAPKGGQSGAV